MGVFIPPELSGVRRTLDTKSCSPLSPLPGSMVKSASLIGRVKTSSSAEAVPFLENIVLMPKSREDHSP